MTAPTPPQPAPIAAFVLTVGEYADTAIVGVHVGTWRSAIVAAMMMTLQRENAPDCITPDMTAVAFEEVPLIDTLGSPMTVETGDPATIVYPPSPTDAQLREFLETGRDPR